MVNQSIILQLLIQDMRYHQLINGINQLGFQNELNGSDMMGIVAVLMEINDITTEWEEAYMTTLNLALHYKISCDGADLRPLAEHCYKRLVKSN